METTIEYNQAGETCIAPQIGGKIDDYLNGSLGAADLKNFELHLNHCRWCKQMVNRTDHLVITFAVIIIAVIAAILTLAGFLLFL